MGKPMRLLLLSFGLGLATEAALLLNWRMLAAHGPVGSGIVDLTWIWPLVWLGMIVTAMGCMFMIRIMKVPTTHLGGRQTAGVMLLQLLVPMLALVGPVIMLLYSLVMVLTAAGVAGQVR
ncbi:MAG: hypothetical protein MK095_05290 [Phycisphaerales bacterium]|nr:hypothetical protein [Phycisphaerales bacterium]